jgi:hypothetical protein
MLTVLKERSHFTPILNHTRVKEATSIASTAFIASSVQCSTAVETVVRTMYAFYTLESLHHMSAATFMVGDLCTFLIVFSLLTCDVVSFSSSYIATL